MSTSRLRSHQAKVPFDGNIREGEHRQAGLRGDLCDAPAVHIV
jgi:hypothetical protein